MMFKIFMILFNFIVNTIKLNSLNIGIITAPIINPNGKFYDFKLSVYGTFVGKRNAECLIGIDKNKPIFIPQSKSRESSSPQESQSNQK